MAFCPRCGHKRLGNFRFCTQCNFDFDEPLATAAAQTPPPPDVPSARGPLATYAGVAWLATAAMMAFLAFQQLEAAQSLRLLGIAGGEDLTLTAVLNGVSALITAVLGLRCLAGATWGFLHKSAIWALVNVGFGVWQVVNGATYWVFYATIIASGLAGLLSWAARADAPEKEPGG